MSFTRDERGSAVLGGVPLASLFDSPATFGAPASLATPAYVYDLDAMVAEARDLDAGFGDDTPPRRVRGEGQLRRPHHPRASPRSASAPEVVSGGELAFVLACGVSPDKVLMSGVGKTARDIDPAIAAGERGILALQLESVEEIALVAARARAPSAAPRASRSA